MALVAPNKHETMHIKNLESAIQMQKVSITVRQCHNIILQFESNHKDDNDLFMIDAIEFYTLYTELKETKLQRIVPHLKFCLVFSVLCFNFQTFKFQTFKFQTF